MSLISTGIAGTIPEREQEKTVRNLILERQTIIISVKLSCLVERTRFQETMTLGQVMVESKGVLQLRAHPRLAL